MFLGEKRFYSDENGRDSLYPLAGSFALTISISRCLISSASRPQIPTIRARSGTSVWDVGNT